MACRVALPFILFSVCFISSSCQSSDCDNSSYCQTKGGVLQNCPYKDGVCCGDDRHCCPKGTVCDIEGQRCKVTNGEAFSIRNLIQCPKTSRNDEFRSVQLVDPSNARSPVLCPDRKAACPDQSTCCPMSGGWGCCEHPNAVCCSDHSHCCPQGYQCDTTKASCIPSNRVSNFMYGFLSMLSRLPTLRQAQTVDSQSLPLARTYEMCEDHRYQCPRGTSCCPTQSGSYACCPMPDAVCCSDGIHCCPKDTICDMASGQCLGSSIKVAAVVPVRPHDPVIIPMVDPQACPDAKYSCLNNQTCCQLKSGEWGCCPIPQAVCCSDHEHCCPSGFHCDTARGMCVRGSLVTTVPSASVKQVCPDPEWQCDDNTTCCELGNKEWGCCDMPNAVCCEDKAHCCPENYQCDIKRNLCTKADATSFLFTGIQTPVKKLRCTTDGFHCPEHTVCNPQSGDCVPDTHGQMTWFRKIPALSTETVGSVVCPNSRWKCPNNSTCCLGLSGFWSCCPIPEAVCCADRLHCCPHGYRCGNETQTCVLDTQPHEEPAIHADSASSVVHKSEIPRMNSTPMVCPGARMQCPEDSTCCEMIDGSWGCCPSKNAVCCSDGLHCCPEDYVCSAVDSSCIRKSTIKPILKLPPSTQDTICPDKRSYCIDHQSCCPLINGDFGCCPLDNGTCCEDRTHCCPEGSVCATEPGECVRPTAKGLQSSRVPARRMNPVSESSTPLNDALLPVLFRTFVPGQVVRTGWCSECGPNGYCCPNALGQHNRMCCDKAGSMCCSDGEYCCPPGTKCVGNGQCDQITEDRFLAPFLIPSKRVGSSAMNNTRHSIQATKSRPAWLDPRLLLTYFRQYKSVRWTICPDHKRACRLDEQCCPSAEQGFVCAPRMATCCSRIADSYCPKESHCSVNGALCHLGDGA